MPSIQKVWKDILTNIYYYGVYHTKDDSEIKEIIDYNNFIDNPLKSIAPNYQHFNRQNYIDFIRNGAFDITGYNIQNETLAEYVSKLDDTLDFHHDDFVYTYPQRLMHYEAVTNYGKYRCLNQIDIIVQRLLANIGSNRAVAVIYHPGLDGENDSIPCLQFVQALVRNNALYLSIFFRSNDIYVAFPANMFFISYLGLYVLEQLQDSYPELTFEGIYYHVSSAHYYKEFDKDVHKLVKMW